MDWNLTWKMKMDEQLQMEKVFTLLKKLHIGQQVGDFFLTQNIK